MDRPEARKDILLEDERNRGFASVVRFGGHLFLSASEGQRSPETEQIDPALASRPSAQVRNCYERIKRRLEHCGYDAASVVRLEHFVSSQDWLLLRLALWDGYFGAGRTTGGGNQGKMSGINMVTAIAIGATPETPRTVVTPAPVGLAGDWAEQEAWVRRAYGFDQDMTRVRPAKAVQAGDFIYLIGARGHTDITTGAAAPVEVPEAFPALLRNTFGEFAAYLAPAGLAPRDLVRVDSPIRNMNRASEYRSVCRELLGSDSVPFVAHVAGMPVGGSGETDTEGIATAKEVSREVAWTPFDGTTPEAIEAGDLVFSGTCSGIIDGRTGAVRRELYGDKAGQARHALDRLQVALARHGADLDALLRLDVFLSDVYFEEDFLMLARRVFKHNPPTINIIGAELEHSADVEVTGIAGLAKRQ